MKQFRDTLLTATILLCNSFTYAQGGPLFKITETGASTLADIILCLNGKGRLSCQNYHVHAENIQIKTTINHTYPMAGITILTPGYKITGCTPYPKTGSCLFATSNTKAASLNIHSVMKPSLRISSPALVLAQAGIFTSESGAPVADSKARTLTITNQGQSTATKLAITFMPALSGGTLIDDSASTACAHNPVLAPNDSCTVTIVPGTPSTIGNAPVTNTMTVTANNVNNSVTSKITTLTYGSLYSNGYVFSIDDSTGATSSVGLVKVAAINDQSTGIAWDADPDCTTSSCTNQTNAWSLLYGQNVRSVPGSKNPNNTGTNGPGNTYLISSILNGTNGNTNTAPATYAAGACVSYNNGGHTDWYLPAFCEISYYISPVIGNFCGQASAPVTQNIRSNLIDIDSSSSVALGLFNGGNSGSYWSSSELSSNVTSFFSMALFQSFAQLPSLPFRTKQTVLGVRCIRSVSP